MTQTPLYHLAAEAVIEPLVNRWIAWPHVFAPVPHSLHLQNYQLKTLQSYLNNPGMHTKSCRNPRLIGGPFVDIPEGRADQVRDFLRQCEDNCHEEKAFAQALTAFQNRLVDEAKGQSLEPYYEQIPAPLRGYVELVYDYFNRPTVRCIESLLYRSPYYKDSLQSFRCFALSHDKDRPYYMSTPRLPDEESIEWHVPFGHSQTEHLFKLDLKPQPLEEVRDLLGVAADDECRLRSLLSSDVRPAQGAWRGSGIRVRYFGHACVLVEYGGVSILTDPFVSVQPIDGGVERFTFSDLPKRLDFVLITHAHHDHFVFESLLRLRHRVGCLVVPRSSGVFYADTSLRLMAQAMGFRHVTEVDPLDAIAFPDGEVVAIPFLGEHSDLPHAKSGYVVRTGDYKILFAADSNCLDVTMYENVRKLLGPIQCVFLGMECVGAPLTWVYGPVLPIQAAHSHSRSRRSNGSNAAAALKLLKALRSERVYIYALGREPWLEYFLALGPSDTDPQITESTKVLETTRAMGFRESVRPYGKFEVHL